MRNVNRMFAAASSVLVALALAAPAGASTRRVCFDLEFKDERNDCPESGKNGVKRACKIDPFFTTKRVPVGLLVELWDKDDPTQDEYIGTWRITGEGTSCATFEWENAAYSKNESNPDVYVVSINQVRGESGGVGIDAHEVNGDQFPDLTWRNTAAVAENCTAGADCMIPASMIFASDPSTDVGLMIQALDTSQRALVAFAGSINRTGSNIEMRVGDNNPCGTSGSCAESQNVYYLSDAGAVEGTTPVHEVGHVLQMREFGQDFLNVNYLLDGIDGHSLTSVEYDSSATTEGWADYVAMVSWWDPNDSSSRPDYRGYKIEKANPYGNSCSDASGMELQVARGFWDMDDVNNENSAGEGSGDDRSSSSTTALLDKWDNFPDGNQNREDFELGPNGVNAYDYDYNGNLNANQFDAFIDHNCLTNQIQ